MRASIKLARQDKPKTIELIKQVKVDCSQMSTANIVDTVIESMMNQGVIECIKKDFKSVERRTFPSL